MNKETLKKILKGTAIGTGVATGGKLMSDKLTKPIQRNANKNYNPKNRAKDFKKILDKVKDKGIKTREHKRTSYNPILNRISYNKKSGPAGVAHELGHADIYNNLPGSNETAGRLSKKFEGISKKVAPTAAGIGVGTHASIKDKNPELAKKVRNATLLTTGLSSLPTVAEEGIASFKGLKQLNNLNSLKKNDIKYLGKQFGAYATDLAPFLASAGYFAYDKMKEGGDDD